MDFIKTINNDYAGVLSLLSSLIMVVVTIIYVGHTKRQADYAKNSAELVAKQIKTDKQPCVVPTVVDSNGSAWNATDYTRMQLDFEINIKNVGNSPAINIYTLADIELQLTNDSDGNKELLHASLLPNFVQALATGEDKEIHIWFGTAEIKRLTQELSKSLDMNWERLRTNPTQNHYVGAKLIVCVFFKNLMGQWCESVVSHEIAWLVYKNPPANKSHNLNENTIPPKQIREGDKFKAVLTSCSIAPFTYKMITEEYVHSVLENYTEESPWLLNLL